MTTDRQFAGPYDPAHVNAVLTEARRMRNAMIMGFLRRLFAGHAERQTTRKPGGLTAAWT